MYIRVPFQIFSAGENHIWNVCRFSCSLPLLPRFASLKCKSSEQENLYSDIILTILSKRNVGLQSPDFAPLSLR